MLKFRESTGRALNPDTFISQILQQSCDAPGDLPFFHLNQEHRCLKSTKVESCTVERNMDVSVSADVKAFCRCSLLLVVFVGLFSSSLSVISLNKHFAKQNCFHMSDL